MFGCIIMNCGYDSLSYEVKRAVLGYISEYPRYLRQARVFSDYDEFLAVTRVYDEYGGCGDNELLAERKSLAVEDVRRRRERAEMIVCAVEEGVDLAVAEAPFAARRKIRLALWDNMTRHVSRDFLEINKKTLTKYRRKVIFHVAVRLELFTECENAD